MNENKKGRNVVFLILSMLIFGTVGIFSKQIPLPSGVIALARALIGSLFLILLLLLKGNKPDLAAIKKNLIYLVLSGIALGANWILFFMACKSTTVPTATLSYYLAPAILVVLSVFIFAEKLDLKKTLLILLSLVGMALASGVIGDSPEGVSYLGIVYGILAACLYATVVIFNKLMKDICSTDKTLVQFLVSAVVLTPYVFAFENAAKISFTPKSVLYLILIGIIHTGLAYVMYFGAASKLSSGSVALYSYIDPVVSIFISVLFFDESINALGIIGAFLIIGSSILGEINLKNLFKTAKNNKNANNSGEIAENED